MSLNVHFYFMDRTQCVKLADVKSGMQVISKGQLKFQCSDLLPLMFL